MQYPISEYFNRIPVFAGAALSGDGSRLAYVSSASGEPQVWLGGIGDDLLLYPKPLTNSKVERPHVMQESLQWIGNDRLACLMDRLGDEQTFIEIQNLKDGSKVSVPTAEGARDYLGFVSKDQKTLYFSSNRGNPASQGLYAFDLKKHTVRKVYHHERESSGWAGNLEAGGGLLFCRVPGNHTTTLHSLNLKTGKVVDLFVERESLILPVAVLPKNRLLVISNHQRQFQCMGILDLKTKAIEYVQRDQWDVEEAKVSPNRKHLLVTRNVAGRSQLELYAFPSLKKQKLSFANKGVIDGVRFAKNNRFAVLGYASPVESRNFYLLDMKTKTSRPLTDNHTTRIPAREFQQPQLIHYPSQGREIYSWLFLPAKAKRNGKLPVVVWPHGGPQWQERAQFRSIFQYFVGRGFALWAPNPTGSTGFGKDCVNAINGQWGTADLPDMENGIAWLKQSGWIDPDKIAIMGGSYGGYMTLRSITKFPKIFKAAVDIFGVSNLLTFVKTVPPDWIPYMDHMVGNAERDEARLREQSPIFAIDKVECPVLVIQGAKDPRVVKAESDQIVESLRQRGKPVEYLVFEDEGHGFLKLENELKAYTAAAEFLERWLGATAPTARATTRG